MQTVNKTEKIQWKKNSSEHAQYMHTSCTFGKTKFKVFSRTFKAAKQFFKALKMLNPVLKNPNVLLFYSDECWLTSPNQTNLSHCHFQGFSRVIFKFYQIQVLSRL